MKEVRIRIRRQGATGRVVGVVREYCLEGRRIHVTAPHDDPHEAAITARAWARTHGRLPRTIAFEPGLIGPGAVGGDDVLEVV